MKLLQKLILIPGIIGMGFGLFDKADAQSKRIRVVDTIFYGSENDSLIEKSGIPDLKVNFNGKESITDNDGYVDLATRIKDREDLEEKNDLKIINNNDYVVFDFDNKASLEIYNINGEKVKDFNENYDKIIWDFKNNHGIKVANGVYPYRLIKKDEIKKGRLNILFGEGKNKVFRSPITSINRKTNLEKILSNYSLSIKDEDTVSSDSINGLGEYFDIKADYLTLDDIPDVIHMIPVLEFESSYYKNILHFIRYMTESLDSNFRQELLTWYSKDRPIKLFWNKDTAPNQLYIDAVDSATSNTAPNSWESMNAFNYKNFNLTPLNLFEEVDAQPDTGSSMDYTDTVSWVDWVWYGPTKGLPRGPPYHAIVYIKNDWGDYWPGISRETKHELGHDLFSSSKHSADPKHNMRSGSYKYISKDEGKSIRIIYSLPDLQNMSIYRSD